jgi:hypothetical protein
MTTFTITCPPTVAETVITTTQSASGAWEAVWTIEGDTASALGGSVVGLAQSSALFSEKTDSDSNIFSETQISGILSIEYSTLNGEAADDFPSQGTNGETEKRTNSWNGGRTAEQTIVQDEGQTITGTTWTSESSSSSQTTTTASEVNIGKTLTTETQVSARTGTLIGGSIPSTTQTMVNATTSSGDDFSTTRIGTTTVADSFEVWRSTATGASHRGTFQAATVVCLDSSEIGWVVTSRPDYTDTFSAVVLSQTATQFTVLPSFVTTAGVVIDASETTSSTRNETQTTYTTTAATGTTLTVGTENDFGGFSAQLPVRTRTFAATTRTTEEYESAIERSEYTLGDISTTTLETVKTHQGRIGNVTWNATHVESITAETTFEVLLSGFSSTDTFGAAYPQKFLEDLDAFEVNLGDIKTEAGEGETAVGATFDRAITQAAEPLFIEEEQNQCGSSVSHGFAAASALGAVGQIVGASGVTVKRPRYVFAARTARAPLGEWSYLDGTSSVSASADAAGLSATTTAGPTSSLTTESASGAWTIQGAAVSNANVGQGMALNMGGVPATGNSLTAFYAAGIFSTSNSAGSGTVEVSEGSTALVGPDNRTVYLPASRVFVAGISRFGTSRRNITDTIAETAIITNRSQLVL